jgi:hypothetical protein
MAVNDRNEFKKHIMLPSWPESPGNFRVRNVTSLCERVPMIGRCSKRGLTGYTIVLIEKMVSTDNPASLPVVISAAISG